MFRSICNARKAAAVHDVPRILSRRLGPEQVTHSTVTSMSMPCCHWHTSPAVDSPTWHFSRSYFWPSRTAVQHDCLALMSRTVLAVQRRHWSPWTCGVQQSLHSSSAHAVDRRRKLD